MLDGWSAIFAIGVVAMAVGLGWLKIVRARTWGDAPDTVIKSVTKTDGSDDEAEQSKEAPDPGPEEKDP